MANPKVNGSLKSVWVENEPWVWDPWISASPQNSPQLVVCSSNDRCGWWNSLTINWLMINQQIWDPRSGKLSNPDKLARKLRGLHGLVETMIWMKLILPWSFSELNNCTWPGISQQKMSKNTPQSLEITNTITSYILKVEYRNIELSLWKWKPSQHTMKWVDPQPVSSE